MHLEPPKLVVHHLNASRSLRILWLLEELDVPYEIKNYQRGADLLAPNELRQVHPLGKSPVITYGDITVAESGAVVEYIIRTFGNGKARPSASGEVDDLYFSHYAEGSLMPLVVNKFVFGIVPGRAPFLLRPLVRNVMNMLVSQMVDPRLKEHIRLIEGHLEKSGDWFAGGDDPTSADFMMVFGVEALVHFFPNLVGPKTKAWVERVHDRPAYKRVSHLDGNVLGRAKM
ncbi:thioredoxin-like protein [Vararia minispora EC-137]|uniref:Thioredoxin-like protein n=1 Tax=Vararia minispora EC-137 TaxID=1314806 RepID=A0ACB8QLS5_9AGAM|nr:thioredoxin-like protein [Vararia minispora EC-137]